MNLIKPLSKEKEKKFWDLIESSNWVKYTKHYPKKHEDFFMKKLNYKKDHTEFTEMENFMILLLVKMNKKFMKNSRYVGVGSDDGWFQLLSNVIARGEEYYNSITKEKLRELYHSDNCYDGFLTDFPYCHPWYLYNDEFLKTIIKKTNSAKEIKK